MQSPGESYPRTAYLLSFIGGILITLLSVIAAIIAAAVAPIGIAVGFGLAAELAVALAIVAVILGVLVIFFAMRLKNRPKDAQMTGILILVLALVSFAGGGGYFIGALLALIGGILALVWKPPMATQPAWGQPAGGAPSAPPSPPPSG